MFGPCWSGLTIYNILTFTQNSSLTADRNFHSQIFYRPIIFYRPPTDYIYNLITTLYIVTNKILFT
jgi:hypothetical protein